MKALFFLVLIGVVYSPFSNASSSIPVSCVCQTLDWPAWQKPFFKRGCKVWLKRQLDCDFKRIEQISVDDLFNHSLSPIQIDAKGKNGLLRLGFVGHWQNSSQSRGQIGSSLLPTAIANNVSIEVENTACRSMDYAGAVQNRLSNVNLPEGKYIRYKGNQTISIGLWDKFTTPRANFFAIADSRNQDANYPACSDYENQACMSSVQKDEAGYCREDDNSISKLRCSKTASSYAWVRQ